MRNDSLPKSVLHHKPIGKIQVDPERDTKTNSCMRVDRLGFISLKSSLFKKVNVTFRGCTDMSKSVVVFKIHTK
jgi:hypothetical protein